VLEGTVNFAF